MATIKIVDGKICGAVAGDHWFVRQNVFDVPNGNTIEKAWFTVKENIEDADADAIVQKEITTINTDGTGHIENDGSTGTAVVRFDLVPVDTEKFKPFKKYKWDIQVKTSAGIINTPKYARGTLEAESQVTIVSS